MPELFIQQENAEGEIEYVAVTDENAESVVNTLPENLVQQHSEYERVNNLYRSAVDESKKRLQRAQKAENALQELINNDGNSEDVPSGEDEGEGTSTPTPQLDEEQLFARFLNRFQEEQKRETVAQTERRQKLEGLIKTHKLEALKDAMSILENSSNPDAVAEVLGRNAAQFAQTGGGDTPPTDLNTLDLNSVANRLGLPPLTKK